MSKKAEGPAKSKAAPKPASSTAAPKAAAPKKEIDWELIERDYRAGILSVREIGASQGITHGAINKRAKRDGWERDLKAKIQAKAEALVSKREVSSLVSAERVATDRVIVEANAERIADVRMAHRTDIARGRRLAVSLLEELEQETGNIDLFQELGEMLRAPDDKGQDKRNDLYMKVISSAGRIDSMKKLADTLKVLVTMEREAYGIKDEGEKVQNPLMDLLRQVGGTGLPIVKENHEDDE